MMSEKNSDGLQENEVLFQVDSLVKKEFLDTQKKSTRIFYSYVLSLADEFELETEKSIFDLNIENRDELLLVKFKNKSPGAFKSNLTPLKKYVDFCILKKLVRHNENRFATILPKDYENYVNIQAMKNSYITKSEVRELQNGLINEQDKLILELLGWSIRGRTEKGNTLEELTNLRVKDIDWDSNVLNLINNDGEFRQMDVDDYTMDLLKVTINKRFYFYNNGLKKNDLGVYEKSDKGAVINETEYVFRVPGKNKFEKTNHQFFEGRMQRIQKRLEKPYLNISNLYFSGMIDYAKKLKEEKGELTKKDYIRINERFQFGEDGDKYRYKTQELVNIYI